MNRTCLRLLFVAVSTVATASLLPAATLVWSGAGTTWSNPASWNPASVPASGDSLVYGAAGGGDSFANLSLLALNSLRFDAAVLPLHNIRVQGALIFSGSGIRNDSTFVPGGVIRQQLFADSGATVIFQNSATIGGATLPVDITARTGGSIRFENTSTASSTTDLLFTALVIEAGAELRFRDDAWTGFTATIVTRGGDIAGSAGGSVIFQDRAALAYRLTNGTGNGLGGRVVFQGNARAQSGASLENDGALIAVAGAEALTQFFADTRLDTGAQNRAADVGSGRGGRLELHDRAGATDASILNWGSNVGGAESGRLQFFDQTTAGNAVVVNAAATESATPNTEGGVTEFFGTSRADMVQIRNEGAAITNSLGGRTFFREDSNAQSANISNDGGRNDAGAPGGLTEFSDRAQAGNATLQADGGFGPAPGGSIVFRDASTGGNARAILNAGDTFGGILELSPLTASSATLGSIEGTGGILWLGSKALTLGANNLSTTFAGTIRDGGLGGGTGSSLTKTGTGTLTLSGPNTYTGTTSVNAGQLFVNGSLANGAVSVAAGSTLGGNGTIGGAVTVADAATLAPGPVSTGGALSIGSLFLNDTSAVVFELGAPGAAGNDVVNVAGTLSLDGVLHVTNLGGFSFGTYRIFNYAGTLTNQTLTIGTVPAGFSAGDLALDLSAPGQVNLVVSGGSPPALYWDGPNTVANNAVDGGSGDWDSTTRNWTNAAGTANTRWSDTFAIFSGAAGTVTLTEDVATAGAHFSTDGYTLDAAGPAKLTLSGATLFRVEFPQIATVNAPLMGSGSLRKIGNGTLILTGASSYTGGTTVALGLLMVRNAAGTALGSGPVVIERAPSELLHFVGNSSAGATTLTNLGSSSSVLGAITRFKDTATAGNATIFNQASTSATGLAGSTRFSNQATAGSATIDNAGGDFPAISFYGQLSFGDDSTAGNSTIINRRGRAAPGSGGKTTFADRSSTGFARLDLEGGTVSTAKGGLVQLGNIATAGGASFHLSGAGEVGAFGGQLEFFNDSNAGSATIVVDGGGTRSAAVLGGAVFFVQNTRARNARFTVGGGTLPMNEGGTITFFGTSSAEAATFSVEAAPAANAGSARVTFFDLANAGSATFVNRGSNIAGGRSGGVINFNDTSGAATATFENLPGGSRGGALTFNDQSTAENAHIFNRGISAAFGESGYTYFRGRSVAGAAVIVNEGGAGLSGAPATYFVETASAATANIINEAGPPGGSGGSVLFLGSATAGSATIIARGGSGTNPSHISFHDTANAGAATLIAEGSTGSGNGGFIQFSGTASGTAARVLLQAGAAPGILDIASLTGTGMAIGTIEGGGKVLLGSKSLFFGSNTRDTEFAGQIAGSGPNALYKSGVKTFTLSGANTYIGRTLVTGGTLAVNGSIVGDAFVGTGATLRGTGTIGGTVVVAPGGTYAPGTSPGTLTVGGLEFDNAAILEYELGATASDQTIVNGDLVLDGVLNILNAGGLTTNTRYDLFRWTGALTDRGIIIGSVPPGFSPSDFRFEFANGAVRLAVGNGGGATPANVTSSLQIDVSGFRLNRSTQRYVQTLTIRNASSASVGGPVSLVLDHLPGNVTLSAATGTTTALPPLGSPFIDLNVGPDGMLSVGETLTLNVEFANPSNQPITYSLRALAGPGAR